MTVFHIALLEFKPTVASEELSEVRTVQPWDPTRIRFKKFNATAAFLGVSQLERPVHPS